LKIAARAARPGRRPKRAPRRGKPSGPKVASVETMLIAAGVRFGTVTEGRPSMAHVRRPRFRTSIAITVVIEFSGCCPTWLSLERTVEHVGAPAGTAGT
jgi:hypothetical protein